MSKPFKVGRVFGLEISAYPSAPAGFLLLWAVLAVLGGWLLRWSAATAIGAGFAAATVHFLSELPHQFGHALAARRTGYPMLGVRYWWVFGASRYPHDEPELPAALHIRRALGGAPASLAVAVVAAAVAWALWPTTSVFFWIAAFMTADNLLVYTLGAFLPLGFTDGSTLLHYWKTRKNE